MKSLFRIFFLLTILFFPCSLFARTYQLKDFSLDVPDSFSKVDSDELLLYLVEDKSGNALSVVYGGGGSFGSHDPLYKYGEVISHRTKKSFFLRLNKKYVKGYYKTNTASFMQYTFTTYNNTYSLFFKYASDSELRQMTSIVKSIKVNDSWLGLFLTSLRNGPLVWSLFFIVVSILAAALHTKGESRRETVLSAGYITIVSTPLLLLFLWGTWTMLLSFIALTFAISYIAARTGYYLSPNSD